MRRAWEQLSVERRATPPKLSDDVFQDWISGRPIFVGSRMDDEMRPSRAAVRARLASIGAEPVMWETITPQDRGPEDAFLEGVDRSDIAVFLTLWARRRKRLLPDPQGVEPGDRSRHIPAAVRASRSPVQRSGRATQRLDGIGTRRGLSGDY